MSLQRLIINTGSLTEDGFLSKVNLASGPQESAISLSEFVAALPAGFNSSLLSLNTGAVQASATITSTGTAANTETMTLCKETLTAVTSGAVPADGEFNISAVVATQAASIAAAINAVVALQGIVTATSALGVVTVTAVVPGLIGNGLEAVDVNLANVAVADFSGGLDGTAHSIDLR